MRRECYLEALGAEKNHENRLPGQDSSREPLLKGNKLTRNICDAHEKIIRGLTIKFPEYPHIYVASSSQWAKTKQQCDTTCLWLRLVCW
jgi:hypothetical protein